jgi:hypothetical protein
LQSKEEDAQEIPCFSNWGVYPTGRLKPHIDLLTFPQFLGKVVVDSALAELRKERLE